MSNVSEMTREQLEARVEELEKELEKRPISIQKLLDDVRIGGPAWVCHYCLKRNTHEMSRCVKCHKERNYLTR
jgi:hypothetical protein